MPGVPHHITQRGIRGQPAFFEDDDYQVYLALMAEWCGKLGVEVWAYCLAEPPAFACLLRRASVQLVAVPESEDGLRRAIGEAHRRYTRRINFREGWRGHLWQSRFTSFPMDESYLLAAARYVELNPVKAGLATAAESYPWSSAAAHLSGKDDVLVKVAPIWERVPDWRGFLAAGGSEKYEHLYKRHESTGRPLGPKRFILMLEKALARALQPRKLGRRPKGPKKVV